MFVSGRLKSLVADLSFHIASLFTRFTQNQ